MVYLDIRGVINPNAVAGDIEFHDVTVYCTWICEVSITPTLQYIVGGPWSKCRTNGEVVLFEFSSYLFKIKVMYLY